LYSFLFIVIHDLQGGTDVMKGALATAAALGGALPREETAAPALMVAGALHQGNAMAWIIA